MRPEWPPLPARETLPSTSQRTGDGTDGGKEKGRQAGTEAAGGRQEALLTSMDPEIIRRIKSAAALRDTTASMVMEEAAAEWLERHQGKK